MSVFIYLTTTIDIFLKIKEASQKEATAKEKINVLLLDQKLANQVTPVGWSKNFKIFFLHFNFCHFRLHPYQLSRPFSSTWRPTVVQNPALSIELKQARKHDERIKDKHHPIAKDNHLHPLQLAAAQVDCLVEHELAAGS